MNTEENNYLSNKKSQKDIPMYDPHTGEPNPFYEELTGKKNPLLRDRKCDLNNIIPFEPKRKNRWLLTFPEEMGVYKHMFNSTTRPKLNIINKKFLGFTYKTFFKWDDINVVFHDPIGPSTTQAIMEWIVKNPNKEFSYFIEMLDPVGCVVEKWLIEGCTITLVDCGTLSYKDDAIASLSIRIKPKTCKLLF